MLGNIFSAVTDFILYGVLIIFDDPFYWLADWATIFFRKDFHKILTGLIFWIVNFSMVIVILYAYLIRIDRTMVVEYLFMVATLFYFSCNYGLVMRNLEIILKGIALIKKMDANWKRPIKKKTFKKVQSFSKYTKKLYHLYIIALIIIYIIFIQYLDKENIAIFVVPRLIFMNNSFLYGFFFGIFLPHSIIFFGATPILINSYFSWHILYRLKILNDYVKKFIKYEESLPRNNLLHSDFIQNKIKEEIIYLTKKYKTIQGIILYYNVFLKWRFLILSLCGSTVMAACICYAVTVPLKECPHIILIFFGAGVFVLIPAESGQQIEQECEKLQFNLKMFKYYKWNKTNRQCFGILLLQTQEPFILNCYGFVILNRHLFVKTYRMIHTFFTYYNSIR